MSQQRKRKNETFAGFLYTTKKTKVFLRILCAFSILV